MRLTMQRSAVTFLLAALIVPLLSPAADWPRFRGPNGAGVAETSSLPDSIGPGKHVVWKTALPPGHSSPVIGGDHIFLTAFEGDKLFTLALDRAIVTRNSARRTARHRQVQRRTAATFTSFFPITVCSPIPSTARNAGAPRWGHSTTCMAWVCRPSWPATRWC
jgi:hypothetical protein